MLRAYTQKIVTTPTKIDKTSKFLQALTKLTKNKTKTKQK